MKCGLGISCILVPHCIMSRPLKRARAAPGRVQRPIDKELKVVNHTTTTSVTSTTLKTVTFPGTVVGLRWSLGALSSFTTASLRFDWAIVVVPDGEAVNAPSTSDGSDFYTPEQNVLAFGSARLPDTDAGTGPNNVTFEGTTKTMRKLKQGDILACISLSDQANSVSFDGIIQFFFKT